MRVFILAFIIATAFCSGITRAQIPADTTADRLFQSRDSIDRRFFLDAADLKGMTRGRPQKKMQVWNETSDNAKGLAVVQDIRLRFDDPTAAIAFQDGHIATNSEGMAELEGYHLDTAGCHHFRIFKDDRYTKMLGLPLMQYCVLFTNGRYFVKLFLTCHDDFKDEDVQLYISSIVKKLAKQYPD